MSTAPHSIVLRSSSETYTVRQAFDEMLQSLQIEQFKPKAAKQQKSVRKKLESRLSLVTSYLTGSYRRNTQILPLDDIDLLLVLDPEAYAEILENPSDGPKQILDVVQKALRDAYPHHEIERYDRCLRIQFSGTGIGFDVIPAFQDSEDVFVIPDEALGVWVPTNPKEHERLVSQANQDCEGMLIPLVKLLKACKDNLDIPLTGFHVEMMAYYALDRAPENYRVGVADLLNDLAAGVYLSVPDPWPLGRRVDEYLEWDRRVEAAEALHDAADRATEAVAADERGDTQEAHAAWDAVFGHWYPADADELEELHSVQKLSLGELSRIVKAGGRISATSFGLTSPSRGLASATVGTSHGGRGAPHRKHAWSGLEPNVAFLEREISRVLRQFTELSRLAPADAAADPTLWPVEEEDVESLYAVLVGDQWTNLGHRHRLAILIPKDTPVVEPAIYDLRPHRPSKITRRGWRPRHSLVHRWGGGVLCTHAARDRWDGQLVTLVIWAVDWLFRQDYRQKFGKWIGPEIEAKKGRLRVNGIVQRHDPLLAKRGRFGRRVPK